MPFSPFLQLDEERQKRDALMRQSLSNVGSSLVSAPLTYDKLMKDAEDRKLKLESDRVKMQQAKEEHELSQDSGKLHNEATELGMKNTELGMKDTQQDMDTKAENNKVKKINSGIQAVVGSGLGRNLDDKAIIQESFNNPDLGELTDQSYVEAEIGKQRDKAKQDQIDTDLKQQALDIKKGDADTRKLKATQRLKNAGVKYKDLPVAVTNQLITINQDKAALAKIMQDSKSIDTGIISGIEATLRKAVKMPEKDRAIFDMDIQRLLNQVIKNQSGATVTANELARNLSAFPDKWTEKEIFDAAIEAMAASLEDKENATLHTVGSMPNYEPTVNYMREHDKTPSKKTGSKKDLSKLTAKDISAMSDEELQHMREVNNGYIRGCKSRDC